MYIKLTDQKMRTYFGKFQWELGKWYSIDKEIRGKNVLCSSSWFHCYDDISLAHFFNPFHAGIDFPRTFVCNVKGKKREDMGRKFGFTFMKLKEEIHPKSLPLETKIRFSVLVLRESVRKVVIGIDLVEWEKFVNGFLETPGLSDTAKFAGFIDSCWAYKGIYSHTHEYFDEFGKQREFLEKISIMTGYLTNAINYQIALNHPTVKGLDARSRKDRFGLKSLMRQAEKLTEEIEK